MKTSLKSENHWKPVPKVQNRPWLPGLGILGGYCINECNKCALALIGNTKIIITFRKERIYTLLTKVFTFLKEGKMGVACIAVIGKKVHIDLPYFMFGPLLQPAPFFIYSKFFFFVEQSIVHKNYFARSSIEISFYCPCQSWYNWRKKLVWCKW